MDPDGWHEAGAHAYRAWARFLEATTAIEKAHALLEVNDAMGDLVTWLPGWNSDTCELEDDGGDG